MKIEDLKVGQRIKFAASEYHLSLKGVVKEKYEQNGQMKAIIKVANYRIIIDNTYLIFTD